MGGVEQQERVTGGLYPLRVKGNMGVHTFQQERVRGVSSLLPEGVSISALYSNNSLVTWRENVMAFEREITINQYRIKSLCIKPD